MAILNLILSYAFIILCIFLTTWCVYRAIQFLKHGKRKKNSTIGMTYKEKREERKRIKAEERKELKALREHIKGGDIKNDEGQK